MTKPPTVPQMLARSLDGHRTALDRIAQGLPVARIGVTAGEVRGLRTVIATLHRWDCIAKGAGTFPLILTARGRELLVAMIDREAEGLARAQAGDVAGWPSHAARADRLAELARRKAALVPDRTITITDPTLDETGRFSA